MSKKNSKQQVKNKNDKQDSGSLEDLDQTNLTDDEINQENPLDFDDKSDDPDDSKQGNDENHKIEVDELKSQINVLKAEIENLSKNEKSIDELKADELKEKIIRSCKDLAQFKVSSASKINELTKKLLVIENNKDQ